MSLQKYQSKLDDLISQRAEIDEEINKTQVVLANYAVRDDALKDIQGIINRHNFAVEDVFPDTAEKPKRIRKSAEGVENAE